MVDYKYKIFTDSLEKNIREGVLKPGYKLPSVRVLKEQYQTSISTIQKGYEYLMLIGLVESVPKSGYFVAHQQQEPIEAPLKAYPVVRDAVFKQHLGLMSAQEEERNVSAFNVATPGDVFMPQQLILRTMQQVIREEGASLLRYYPASGSPVLKGRIITRATRHQTYIHEEALLLTDGALQALYIALAAVCEVGDVIAVESPCVFSVLEVIRMLRLKVVEVPIDLRTGFDIDFFKQACDKNNIKALVVTPNFNNPTGLSLSNEQKIALIALVHRYNVALIENDMYSDLYFQGERPSLIKRYDDSGLVLSYGSYAKTLAPGIRLGWLSAGKFMARAEQIKFALGSSVSPIYQETVSRILAGTAYDRHLRSFRLQLAKNAHFAMHLIADNFPTETTFVRPQGGYHLWVRMPDTTDMSAFYALCDQIGVKFTPGSIFSFSGAYDRFFRMIFADRFSKEKIEAIRLLGRAIR
ncbi:aminotransferase-like domain-containing protein [Sphingobacterium sp. MYb382]|uniref:aminotransferase-like domain-containing protein n=1 Tax=Sphingobacterium sp. MYb382 TaxID=2745278 RepID=UPI0030AF7031